jgi:uncharacterized DUF497 family protein
VTRQRQTASSSACCSKIAALAFDDPFHASKPDLHPDGDRWHTIGLVGSALLLVIHTWPEAESKEGELVGRIISARKATVHERKTYEEGNF